MKEYVLILMKNSKYCKIFHFLIIFFKRKQIDSLKAQINNKINEKIVLTKKQISRLIIQI